MRRAVPLSLMLLTATTALADPAAVTRQDIGDGVVLADAKGMTLYRFDMDKTPGTSACVDACANAWPALIAPADVQPDGAWSIIVRPDQTHQWAYDGKPLYTYMLDKKPGDANGDGMVFNLWHRVFLPMATPPGLTMHGSNLGHVLADAAGMTLYVSDTEKDGRPHCEARCTGTWIPLSAPSLGDKNGEWSVVHRADGIDQWAWRGRPLYRYAHDFKPGETNGDGHRDGFHAALLRPSASLPEGLIYKQSDLGRVVADGAGRTLYALVESADRPKVCDDDCVSANWRPAMAPASDPSLGPGWSIEKRPDGSRQWAYKGRLLYSFRLDEKAGDIRGDRFGNMASGGFAPFEPVQPNS